jgi:hypothetical protein
MDTATGGSVTSSTTSDPAHLGAICLRSYQDREGDSIGTGDAGLDRFDP